MIIKTRVFGPDEDEEYGGDGYDMWEYIGEIKSLSARRVYGRPTDSEYGFYVDLTCFHSPDSTTKITIGRYYFNPIGYEDNSNLYYDYTSYFEEPEQEYTEFVELKIKTKDNESYSGLFYKDSVYVMNEAGKTIDKY